MTQSKNILLILFIVCWIFIISAAFNYGFTRFYMGLPFMIYATVYSFKRFKNKSYGIGVVALCGLAVLTNKTLEMNSLVFPILTDGEVRILKDGFYRQFSDNSGHFIIEENYKSTCNGCGPVVDTELSADRVLKVTGIVLGHADFSTNASALTEVGTFSQTDQLAHKGYEFNKKIESSFFSNVGILMYYPILPTMIPSFISGLVPAVEVVIVDDAGHKRPARLSYSVAKTRGVKKHDEIRLNCLSHIKHGDNKLCSLEFSGFDRSTPYPKNNPNYGIYAPMTVSISKDGVPESSVLTY